MLLKAFERGSLNLRSASTLNGSVASTYPTTTNRARTVSIAAHTNNVSGKSDPRKAGRTHEKTNKHEDIAMG